MERRIAGRHTHYFNHMSAQKIIRYIGQDIWDTYFTFTIEREPFGKAISSYYFGEGDSDRSMITSQLALPIDFPIGECMPATDPHSSTMSFAMRTWTKI
jgi:hypothetical protein